jgi:hypothetical protein
MTAGYVLGVTGTRDEHLLGVVSQVEHRDPIGILPARLRRDREQDRVAAGQRFWPGVSSLPAITVYAGQLGGGASRYRDAL